MSSGSSRPDPRRLDAASAAAGWRLILAPDRQPTASPLELTAFASRLASLVGPGQAASVLAPASAAWSLDLLPAAQVAQARLLSKRARFHQLAALRLLAAAGIEGIVIKGFDFAHRLYDDPLDRIGEDLDLLLRRADLEPAVARLRAAGWRFGQLKLPPWGSIARASIAPLRSPDGATMIDLHLEADEWPLPRALPTEQLFATAERFACEDLTLRAPKAEDSLLLLVSNLGKDKFGPFGVRKLLDAALLLRRHALPAEATVRRANDAGLGRPLRTHCGLLRSLGLDLPAWPATPTGRAFAALLADVRGLSQTAPGGLALLRREFSLCADWRIALRRNRHRLRGLLKGRRPAGTAPRT